MMRMMMVTLMMLKRTKMRFCLSNVKEINNNKKPKGLRHLVQLNRQQKFYTNKLSLILYQQLPFLSEKFIL